MMATMIKNTQKRVTINVYLDVDVKEAFKALSKLDRRSMSVSAELLILRAITDHIDADKGLK
jgi:hypothetical protein|tara:strand:+ start:349 stop:534 length:186 start_codon:yes stop_codon:yes gene_type:complete